MDDIHLKLKARDLFGYAIAYAFWLLAALVALAAVFMIRTALNALWPITGWSRWVLRPIDRFGLVFLGLLWLVYVIFCEQHFRSSITAARYRRMNESMRVTPRAETAAPGRFMRTLAKLELDILARRLVLTFAIPLAVLGLAYLAYLLSWRLMVA
jgi:hypothetical protein